MTRWPHVILLDPFIPGLALARTMVGLGARVTVIEAKPFVTYSRRVESVVVPLRREDDRWLLALRALAAGSEECVVLSGSDRGSELLALTQELPENVHAFEHDDGAHLELMNKDRAGQIARSAGVRVPWSARVSDEAELALAVAHAPWPCVVKPALSHEWREQFGEERAFLVADPEVASELMGPPLERGLTMMLCQYVQGGDADVEEAILVRAGNGEFPVCFGCRKLRQHPPGFGSTAVGEASPLPETMALARRVLEQADFVGVAGVETKRDAVTDERWFLEVNVRLPAQWGLGDACGVEASRRLIATMCGADLDTAPPLRRGVRFVRPELDWRNVAAAVRAADGGRRGQVAYRSLRPYVGARELGILDLRDPGPALRLLREFSRRRVKRALGGLRRAAPV